MPLYARAMDLKLAMPARPDTFSPEALEAVAMMRRLGFEKKVESTVARLVTKHGHRRIRPHAGKPSAGYERVKRLALAHGWTITEYESPTGHAIQGRRGDIGFRAMWQWGKTTGCSWHEREPRWTLISDTRPVKMNERDHVALKGYRGRGMGTTRLKLLGAPWGLPLGVTELEERIVQ